MSNQQQQAPGRGITISDHAPGEGIDAALDAFGFGGEPTGEPQQEVQEAPTQGEGVEGVEGAEGEGGAAQAEGVEEARDELAEALGVDPSELKPRTRERFQALTAQLNEAKAREEALLAALGGKAPVEEAAPEPPPAPVGKWYKPPDAPGEDADELDVLMHQRELQMAERFNAAMGQMGQEFIGAIAPLLQDTVKAKVDKEWEGVSTEIGKLGYERKDIEPLVNELRKADPNRTLKSLAYEAVSTMPLKQPSAAQVPPTTATPGGGRPTAPAAPKGEATSVDALLKRAGELGAAGNKHDATDLLAQAFLGRMGGR